MLFVKPHLVLNPLHHLVIGIPIRKQLRSSSSTAQGRDEYTASLHANHILETRYVLITNSYMNKPS
jgi:hypothetical protein